ncbi:hypothetical protein Pelo_11199 [Pelomyxa schiedti]|nr:hypothetical protein Pelo_11199 [Pelomyxa schiedti]
MATSGMQMQPVAVQPGSTTSVSNPPNTFAPNDANMTGNPSVPTQRQGRPGRSTSRDSMSRSPSPRERNFKRSASPGSKSHSPDKNLDSDNTTIYVGNLDYDSTAKEIYKEFSEFGPIVYTAIPLFPTETSKGYGFIQYANPASAEKAVKLMHQSRLHGRCITVRWATRGAHRGRVDEYRPNLDGELKHERDRIVRVSGDLSPEPRRFSGYQGRPPFRPAFRRSRAYSRSRSRSWSRSRSGSRSRSRSFSRRRRSSSRSRSSRSRSTSRSHSRSRSPQIPKPGHQLTSIGTQPMGAVSAPLPQQPQPIVQSMPSVAPVPIPMPATTPLPVPTMPTMPMSAPMPSPMPPTNTTTPTQSAALPPTAPPPVSSHHSSSHHNHGHGHHHHHSSHDGRSHRH